ncbi:unnamed protein product [Kuraishia capsulata CBS 1993]|uniref:Uncharacterized protein n=1 Tax=Kuraishia capsulata CBS 1993 TaxID=1382522 RepID=W6MN19_9ASCO|nr:uncharacterized protein KUCA_T00002394001 [Kuraishia capsulata CBS 1993]CDK26422.1 unnamed protein product [Kuraishia capsulata CBS 1993]
MIFVWWRSGYCVLFCLAQLQLSYFNSDLMDKGLAGSAIINLNTPTGSAGKHDWTLKTPEGVKFKGTMSWRKGKRNQPQCVTWSNYGGCETGEVIRGHCCVPHK